MTAAGERGQATVELALLLPVLAMALAAVAQLTVLARDDLLVVHAAREAARAAAVEPGPDAVRRAALAATGLDPGRLEVSVGPERRTGDRLEVAVGYRAPTDVLLIGPLVGDVSLRSSLTVRVE